MGFAGDSAGTETALITPKAGFDSLARYPLFVVQHHPSRDVALERCLASLDREAVVVTDVPDRKISSWRSYRRCLEHAAGTDAQHVVVLQDDTVCQPGFAEAATAAVTEKPGCLVSFFHGPQPPNAHRPIRNAVSARQPFWLLPRGRWVPVVALAWPVDLARQFLHWCDTVEQVRTDYAGDDALVGKWAQKQRVPAWVTAPSLVEHPDDQPSMFGKRGLGRRRAVLLADDCHEWMRLLPPSAALSATFGGSTSVS